MRGRGRKQDLAEREARGDASLTGLGFGPAGGELWSSGTCQLLVSVAEMA